MSITALPQTVVDGLNVEIREQWENSNNLILVEFTISARTTNDEYRCRELRYDDDDILTFDSDLPDNHIDAIRSYINSNFSLSCPYGKYPEVQITGNLNEVSVEYEDGYSYGAIEYEGSVWIYISH